MKKIGVFIVVAILAIEIVLLVKIARSGQEGKNHIIPASDESGFKTQLSAALQQVESLKKESESLKTSVDAAAMALHAKEQELQDAIKASEMLQSGVAAKFDEYQKKATEFDNRRKSEIDELNKKIEMLNNEKTALNAKLDEELKKRDATIEQLNKSIGLSEKVLGEERQRTEDLTKQLNDEKGKVKVLTDQTLAATTEKANLKKELDEEKQKSAALAAENEILKKKVEELSKKQ